MSFLRQVLVIFFVFIAPLLLVFSILTHNVGATSDQLHEDVKSTVDFQLAWEASSDATYQLRASLNKAALEGTQDDPAIWHSAWLEDTELPFLAISGAAEGVWYWQVRTQDKAGTISEWGQPRQVTVDMTAPGIETSIEDGTQVKGIVGLDFSVHDLRRETCQLVIMNDNDEVMTGLSEATESEPGVYRYSWNTTSHTKGMYRLLFTARDKAGNQTTLIRTVEILPPSFELIGATTSDPLLEQLSRQLSQPFVASPRTLDRLPVMPGVAAATARGVLYVHRPELRAPVTDWREGGSVVVAPSENGWRIFGIVWYWWLCITIVAVLMYRRLKLAQLLPA